jgi:hypothetical protein
MLGNEILVKNYTLAQPRLAAPGPLPASTLPRRAVDASTLPRQTSTAGTAPLAASLWPSRASLLPAVFLLLALPTGPTRGWGWKRAAEPGGATHSWLHLASGSRPQLHRQLHGRSRPGAPRLAGLHVEPELEPLLEPCQTGPKLGLINTRSTAKTYYYYYTAPQRTDVPAGQVSKTWRHAATARPRT